MDVQRALRAQRKGCIMQDLPQVHPKYVATMTWAQYKNTSTHINISCNTDYSSQPVTCHLWCTQHEEQPLKLVPPVQVLPAALTTSLYQAKMPNNLVGIPLGLQHARKVQSEACKGHRLAMGHSPCRTLSCPPLCLGSSPEC